MEKKTEGKPEDLGVRFLYRLKDKQATRPLYEQTFQDSKVYVDLYYREKCRDNVIAVKEEPAFSAGVPGEEKPAGAEESGRGRVLSMAHLNPYLLSVRGLPVRTFMLAAVATVPESRRKGHMRDVLDAAFDWLAEQGVPFVILLPVDPAIYEPFGFEAVCEFTKEEPEIPAEEYDVYIIPDLAVRERRAAERAAEETLKAAGEQDEDWPEDPVIMAKVTDAAAFDRMAGRDFDNDAARLAWLRSLKICISEGV